MGEEDGFLRAIAAAPADDTPRLVYADWLEERGQPERAAALRLDWSGGPASPPSEVRSKWCPEPPPPEDRYPPALRRLTEAAADLSVEWLAAATRLGWEVRALADLFAARVPVTRPAPTESGRDPDWQAAVARIRKMFGAHVGDEVVRERFTIPVDYALFATGVGGLACANEYGMSFFDALFGPAEMARGTESSCTMYAEDYGPGDHLAACGLWLFVGFRDKHDLHLCCDRASPLFGAVVDQHDSHPWIDPPHGPDPWDRVARTFLDYLRLQVAKAERARDESP